VPGTGRPVWDSRVQWGRCLDGRYLLPRLLRRCLSDPPKDLAGGPAAAPKAWKSAELGRGSMRGWSICAG
jgi:hypothetical protein